VIGQQFKINTPMDLEEKLESIRFGVDSFNKIDPALSPKIIGTLVRLADGEIHVLVDKEDEDIIMNLPELSGFKRAWSVSGPWPPSSK